MLENIIGLCMEDTYQLNQFKTIDNASHGKATHQLFGYIGEKEEIIGVINKFLGIEQPFLF